MEKSDEMKELKHLLNCHPVLKTDIVKAENTLLIDRKNNVIVDFEAGSWCTALGHCHPRINKVMITQINIVTHLNYLLTSDHPKKLAGDLLDLVEFKSGKAIFLSSGSEAVLLAIRLAKLISRKGRILSFSTAYLSAFDLHRHDNCWVEVDFRNCQSCHFDQCTSKCPYLIEIDFSSITTFIFEPAFNGGVSFPPKKLVTFIVNKIMENNGVIIANEVTTGFGRTGKWFGYEHYDLKPNIITLGKALGNGYPISGVLLDKKVSEQIKMKNFLYVQSHQNDPLGCVVAYEVIEILEDENFINRSKIVGDFFLEELRKIQRESTLVNDVRGRGLMIALELNRSNITENIAKEMLQLGYFIGTTPRLNIIRFFPALTISKVDIKNMCDCLLKVIKQIERGVQ